MTIKTAKLNERPPDNRRLFLSSLFLSGILGQSHIIFGSGFVRMFIRFKLMNVVGSFDSYLYSGLSNFHLAPSSQLVLELPYSG